MPDELKIDDNIIVEIDDPVADIQQGQDADGLPKTIPAKAEKAEKPPVRERKPSNHGELEALRRERDVERQERQNAAVIAERATTALAAERERRKRAEADADKRTDQTKRAYWGKVVAEDEHIDTMISSHKVEMATAKAALRAAYENGQHDQIPDLQEQIGKLAAAELKLQEVKRQTAAEVQKTKDIFREEAPRREEEPEPEVLKPQPQPKKITEDEWIAQFPRATRTFLEQNKDLVTDPTRHQELMKWSKEWAEDYGNHTLHTPDFVKAMKEKFAKPAETEMPETETDEYGEKNTVEVDTAPPKPKPAPSHAAPVSRNVAPGKPSTQGTKVRLTHEQANVAIAIYPDAKTPQEAQAWYARDLLRAQADGRFEPR